MSIWAVIPTYNERGNIGTLVNRLFATLPDVRILVVDDNSPDGTADAVRTLKCNFPGLELLVRTSDRGFGRAYIAGLRRVLEHGEAEAVLTMDADLSHDPQHIPAMRARLATCDMVIGSRYVAGGDVSGWNFSRRLLSRAGNAYVRMVTRMPFRDCSSGFGLIRTKALAGLDLDRFDCTGYAFHMQLKYAIWLSGAAMEEVPIFFRDRVAGESKLSAPIVLEGLRAPWVTRTAMCQPKGDSSRR